MKRCTKCKISKYYSEFHRMKSSPDGYKPRCKECRNSSGRKYYTENSDKVKESHKRYYRENLEYRRAKIKEYGRKNKDKASERSRRSYERNRDEILIRNRETSKQRCLRDPVYKFRLGIAKQLREALSGRTIYTEKSRMYGITGLTGVELINHLWSTFEKNYGIPRNWVTRDQVHIDHVVPKSRAKTIEEVKKLNHYTNLQLLFKEDNEKKHTKGANNE